MIVYICVCEKDWIDFNMIWHECALNWSLSRNDSSKMSLTEHKVEIDEK